MRTKVIFRKVYDGEIVAVFPFPHSRKGFDLECYAHIGQHQGIDYDFYRDCTKTAEPCEYGELFSELIAIGYKSLQVVKRLPPMREIFRYRN